MTTATAIANPNLAVVSHGERDISGTGKGPALLMFVGSANQWDTEMVKDFIAPFDSATPSQRWRDVSIVCLENIRDDLLKSQT